MPSVAVVTCAAAGVGALTAKPAITWTSTGTFTISPLDSSATYTTTGGTRTSAVVNGIATTGSATVAARSGKSLTSSSTVVYRQANSQDWVSTGPDVFSYTSDGSNGGTYYPADGWGPGEPEGYYAITPQGYYVNHSYASTGYTDRTSEWSKVV